MGRRSSPALVLFAVFIGVSPLSPALSQGEDGVERRGDYERAISFFHQVQVALQHNRPSEVEPLVCYPLRVYQHGHSAKIRNRTEFLRHYPSIFTPARRAVIVGSKDSDLWWRDQGYSIEDGVIWFESYMPDGQQFPPFDSVDFWKAGKFCVKTVNQAREEAK